MSEQEIEVEAIAIDVAHQPIELVKVLKIANLVGGGGEAKAIINEGYIAVNGELEQRKRRKMYDGDIIEFNQEYYVVLCDQPVGEPVENQVQPEKEKTAAPVKESAAKKEKKKDDKKASGKADSSTGRRQISF